MKNHTTLPDEIPYGYCHCGCGQRTKLAEKTNKRDGATKGQPFRFLPNHKPTRTLEQAFWRHVIRGAADECWLWQGNIGNHGYGYFSCGHRKFLAHRASYEIHNGALPDDLCVLHHCDVRHCVNPYHLFLGDRTDNAADKVTKGRQFRGEQSPNAKLAESDVKQIRSLAASGVIHREIAQKFHIARETVGDIVRRRLWAHVP